MAIPTGTTANQLASLARWVFAGVTTVGMLAWWQPGFTNWGCLSGGLLLVLAIWFLWRIVADDRTVPRHPAHLVFIAPAVILLYHISFTGLGLTKPTPSNILAGGLEMSLLTQLAMLSGCVLVAQSLLARSPGLPIILLICGGATMGGTIAAVLSGKAQPAQTALTLLGFAGAAIWLTPLLMTPLWMRYTRDAAGLPEPSKAALVLKTCHILAGLASMAALSLACPAATGLAMLCTAAMLLAAGAILRPILLVPAAAMACGSAAMLYFWPDAIQAALPSVPPAGLVGIGERWFARPTVTAADSGLSILGGMLGWAGLAWLVGGLVCCMIWMFHNARKLAPAARIAPVVWMVAGILATLALLSPGGLVVPSITLGMGFVWGLSAGITGRPDRTHNGLALVVCMVSLMLLLGITRNEGFLVWAVGDFGGTDALLHAVAGLFTALALTWILGSRQLRLGLAGLGIAVLAGLAAEIVQKAASSRDMEMRDWLAHCFGCAVAAILYLLAIASRQCESSDVKNDRKKLEEKYL